MSMQMLFRDTKRRPRVVQLVVILAVASIFFGGCRLRPKAPVDSGVPLCSDSLQKIYYPDLTPDPCNDSSDLLSGPPMTLSNFQQMDRWEITLDEAVHMALTNSKVLQRLGGAVVSAPQAATTSYEPAIAETNPLGSVESALSAFDAQVASSLFFNHSERKFNNTFQSLFSTPRTDTANFLAEVSKQTAAGTRFAVRNITDYTNSHIDPGLLGLSPFRFNSVYNTVNQFEVRQPLLRGNGVAVNRIAGPNALPGQYNGVLIARIRNDISLTDFEANVRDLVRDVERNYWELYFAYRDFDTKIAAKEAARETWANRQIRLDKDVGRPDEEAQARQQYYTLEAQVQNALMGTSQGQLGVMGAERNMRRLLGLPVNDGRMLRPSTDPAIAPIVFDWNAAQEQSLALRVELRRQKWTIKQRELELVAAKQLNTWRLDLVGQYGFRGFGDNLLGSRSRPEGSAVADMFTSKLDDWQLGLDMQGPVGMRQGHLAIRNAELRLAREKTVLREQQRQILHDLAAAYAEIDRAMTNIKTAYNAHIASQEELDPKRLRVEEGKDQVFFLLDAQQRYANAESAFYRAIVDYNLALLNFTYAEGTLLSRYQIYLNESEWDEGLQMIARDKASRFVNNNLAAIGQDVPPLSDGIFNQGNVVDTSAQMGNFAPGIEQAPSESDNKSNPRESLENKPVERPPTVAPAGDKSTSNTLNSLRPRIASQSGLETVPTPRIRRDSGGLKSPFGLW